MATAVASRLYAEHQGAVHDPMRFAGQPVIPRPSDNAIQCAELVKELAGAPRTQPDNWKKGMALTPAVVASLTLGTPIASGWDARGFYPNGNTGQHSGIYAGVVLDKKSNEVIGFKIIEQYRGLLRIQAREVYFDPAAHGKASSYLNNGLGYATIQW
ncbi:BPSL0067 family protein [Roseateles chitosanitabidus]|jgi:hypothetical protein|uniref:BPSL0067 family protein n=1 Tax=Roseateles chitosanitabidus TaxID=65048 RepID=UPI0008333A5C|nr:BPSL0067 family protein [Roseateles chitosanitabidus]MBO9685447.1 BPSL0067 family protein [Roseateles chitosanitabidus]